jgi:microcystin degradation protein MlrC
VAIGAELDLHCHLTETMRQAADVIVIYKEYPHTDMAERARDLYRLVTGTAEGRIRPVMATHDCRMIGLWRTSDPAVRRFVDRMTAHEGRDGILSVSFGHGFPWADVADVGVPRRSAGRGYSITRLPPSSRGASSPVNCLPSAGGVRCGRRSRT